MCTGGWHGKWRGGWLDESRDGVGGEVVVDGSWGKRLRGGAK